MTPPPARGSCPSPAGPSSRPTPGTPSPPSAAGDRPDRARPPARSFPHLQAHALVRQGDLAPGGIRGLVPRRASVVRGPEVRQDQPAGLGPAGMFGRLARGQVEWIPALLLTLQP